ncbi:MAG: sigma factor [Planctomycetaceae bacterium]
MRDFKDRDDVLQELAVAAIESFDAYDSKRPFVPWVMGVARNQIGLYLRWCRRDRLVFDEETVSCLVAAFSEVSSQERHNLDALSESLNL